MNEVISISMAIALQEGALEHSAEAWLSQPSWFWCLSVSYAISDACCHGTKQGYWRCAQIISFCSHS